MAKRKRIFRPTIDELIVQKIMKLHNCDSKTAWNIHRGYLISKLVA